MVIFALTWSLNPKIIMLVGSRLKMTSTLSALILAAAIGLYDRADASLRPTYDGRRISGLNESGVAKANKEERMSPSITNHVVEEANHIMGSLPDPLYHEINAGLLELSTISTKEAFTHLELDKAGKDLLSHSSFKAWERHAMKMNKENPEAAVAAMVETLLDSPLDIVALLKEMAEIRKVPTTNNIAARLLTGVMDSWAGANINAKNVFKLLKLDTHMDNQLFEVWIEYLVKMNNDKPVAARLEMEMTLAGIKFDTVFLMKKLTEIKKVPTTYNIATCLLTGVVDSWVGAKINAKNVFKLLELDTHMDNLLFEFWIEYLVKMNNGEPEAAKSEMEMTLARKKFDGVFFLKKLTEFRKVTATKDIATFLQIEIFDLWDNYVDRDAKIVFESLGLDRQMDSVIFGLWTYKFRYDIDDEMSKAVLDVYEWDKERLVRSLTALMKDDAVKDIAVGLQSKTIESFAKKVGRVTLFEWLELHRNLDNLLSNPNFHIFLHEVSDDPEVIMDIIRHFFPNDMKAVAKMLKAARTDPFRSTEFAKLELQLNEGEKISEETKPKPTIRQRARAFFGGSKS